MRRAAQANQKEPPMSVASNGDTVKVHYTGALADGTQFDSSAGREPLEFVIGGGGIIAGLEQAVIGMAVGETKRVIIPADQAYGPWHDALVQLASRSDIPAHIELAAGMILEADGPGGQRVRLTVIELDDESVTVDANHRLAGRDLTFDLELVAIS
jgi:peptidylprolyl isomerase